MKVRYLPHKGQPRQRLGVAGRATSPHRLPLSPILRRVERADVVQVTRESGPEGPLRGVVDVELARSPRDDGTEVLIVAPVDLADQRLQIPDK